MMKSFNDIKKIISLLTLEIKRLDPTSKYSAIVHLEETIDILKLEALKELPQSEEDIKDEDISSENLNDYEDMIMNDYEDIESNAPDEDNDNRIEKNHERSTNQELNKERDNSIQVSNTDIKGESDSYTDKVPLKDPNPSGKCTFVTVEDDDKTDTNEHVCKICETVFASRGGLMIHYNIHLGKFTCHRCKAPFKQKRELDTHISNHVNCLKLQKIRAYANPLDWIVDPSNPILQPELSGKRPPRKKKAPVKKPTSFYCDSCSVSFSTAYRLRRHQEGPVHEEKVSKLLETKLTPQNTTKKITK